MVYRSAKLWTRGQQPESERKLQTQAADGTTAGKFPAVTDAKALFDEAAEPAAPPPSPSDGLLTPPALPSQTRHSSLAHPRRLHTAD